MYLASLQKQNSNTLFFCIHPADSVDSVHCKLQTCNTCISSVAQILNSCVLTVATEPYEANKNM